LLRNFRKIFLQKNKLAEKYSCRKINLQKNILVEKQTCIKIFLQKSILYFFTWTT
jgi:hypothetical protein